MKANMKLPVTFVVIASIIALSIAYIGFSAISIILIIGVLYLVVYLVLGIIRRNDAIMIDDNYLIVVTPFKKKEYEIDKISSLSLDNDTNQLVGVYNQDDEEIEIKFANDMYTKTLSEIYDYLVSNYRHLKK